MCWMVTGKLNAIEDTDLVFIVFMVSFVMLLICFRSLGVSVQLSTCVVLLSLYSPICVHWYLFCHDSGMNVSPTLSRLKYLKNYHVDCHENIHLPYSRPPDLSCGCKTSGQNFTVTSTLVYDQMLAKLTAFLSLSCIFCLLLLG